MITCTFHRTGSRYETVWALNSELRGSVLAKHGFILIYYVARKELKPRRLFFNFIQLKLVKLWLSMSFSFLVYLSSVFSSFVNFLNVCCFMSRLTFLSYILHKLLKWSKKVPKLKAVQIFSCKGFAILYYYNVLGIMFLCHKKLLPHSLLENFSVNFDIYN